MLRLDRLKGITGRGAAELLLLDTTGIEDIVTKGVVVVEYVTDVDSENTGVLVGGRIDEGDGEGTGSAEEVAMVLGVKNDKGAGVLELETEYTVVMTDRELNGQLNTLGGQPKTVM
ncbi:hypothetical protein MMC13_002105 [Lambiella insularis]|nr:hypothetical protein [Lambiella insularis]